MSRLASQSLHTNRPSMYGLVADFVWDQQRIYIQKYVHIKCIVPNHQEIVKCWTYLVNIVCF